MQAQYMQVLEHNLPTVCQWLDSFGYSFSVIDGTLSITRENPEDREEEGESVTAPLGKFVCLKPGERVVWVADEAPPIEEENQQVSEVSGRS